MRSRLIALLLVCCTAVAFAIGGDYPLAKPQIASNAGKAAPDFTLKDQEGKDFSLAAQKGHKVLVVFYRAYWCPYCMAQLKDLAANQAKFEKLGVRIVAISADTQEKAHQVWEGAANKQFSILSDPELRVIRRYGLFQEKGINDADVAIRTLLLVDKKGIEVFRRVSATAADIPKAEELLERIAAGK